MSSELLQSPCPLALERHAGENNYKNVQAKKYRGRLVIATLKKEDDAITLHTRMDEGMPFGELQRLRTFG